MKKALALILVLVMLCATLVPVVSAATPVTINLQELFADNGYASTYVGKALSKTDAKPDQDGVIEDGEYQKEYVVSKDGSKDTYRSGSNGAIDLRNDYKEYVSHDDQWIYFAVDFQSCVKSTTNFYWNLSFIDSFEFDYVGGTAANTAFTQNGRGIKEGWLFGTKIDTTSQNLSNAVPSTKTAPVENTDYVLATSKENLGESKWAGYYDFRCIHEIKISKAWYAAQVGVATEDVRELAWFTYAEAINGGASSYTQIAHLPSTNVLSALETEGGAAYTGTASNTSTNSDKVLPRFFILDDEPEAPDDRLDLKAIYDSNGYASTYVGKALADGDAKPVQNGIIGTNEYQKMRVVSKDGSSSIRKGAAAPLLADYKEYISHDDKWIYVAFDFIAGASTITQFNYYLSFIDSFKFNYYGGDAVNTAFQQNGIGINAAWHLNAVSTQTNAPVKYGETGLTVNATGVEHSTDFDIAGTNAADTTTHAKALAHQVYEIKISKDWYAAKVGLANASEVKNVAWYTSMAQINTSTSSWTYVGHVVSDADRAALKSATGLDYTGDSTATTTDIDGILPHFFILDEPGTDWEQFAGDNNLTVNVKPVTEVPVIDGVIGATEYPSTRTINVADLYNYNAAEVQGTEVVEYFGHDAEYIYYAAQFTQTRAGARAYYLQFKPDNTFDVFNEHYSNRIQYNSRYSEDEDGNNTSYVNNITVNGGTWATPVNDKDIFFYAEKDANSVKTYEFKISKAYIAAVNGIGLDDVKVVPYYVSFHDVCMLGGTFTSDLKVAIATAGGDIPLDDGKTPCYYFMTLEDGELLKVEDRLAINTLETASIRLSPNNPGLRFKSVISTADLKALMSKYDYIKVGTLIAPEDFDLDLSTVVDDDSLAAGTNYIDVVADVNTPFGSDKSIHMFAGSIVNLHENNIARRFEALGYIAYSADGVNWTYVYAGEASFRSAAEVAHNAIESGDYDNDAAALEILEIYAAKFAN